MTFRVRTTDGISETQMLGEAFAEWQGGAERWLLFTPHDDDVVIGAGMLLRVAADAGVETHIAVVTDGRMGYCSEEQKASITSIRRRETETALDVLGAPHVHWLGYPDCDLDHHTGRRAVEDSAPGIAGHTGLQNSFTALLRKLRPSRVFVPTGADYHPDHKMVHRELLVSLFHASGAVWPELGEPLLSVPSLYEMAIYADFPGDPSIQLHGDSGLFDTKLAAVEAYRSQEQIAALLHSMRQAGPYEYFRETPFRLYDSRGYRGLFEDSDD